ncbi:restriction endonuclease [Streptomyces asiaticus]|uniref:restriction endonuclease n=1 Tax=Streptomyces asiaticus TaxID=114695 RepID=UPI003D75C268
MERRSSPAHQIHPAAYGALSDALASIYWYKRDLAQFIRRRVSGHPELLSGLDFDAYKRVFADEFVDRLMADEDRYQELALSIMLEVSQLDSFPSLKRHADANKLLPAAHQAVASLRKWTSQHQSVINEREKLAKELAERRANVQAQQNFSQKMADLKNQFMELDRMPNRQKAGLLFEPFLNDLFALFDLEPRLSYTLEDEQIDGSLSFDTDDYIVEAKWRKDPVEVEDVVKFDDKVKRKGRNALGIFVSVNGFSSGARRRYEHSTSFITMEGSDLFCVLEGRIPLDELLRRKKRHANETGNCYFPPFLALSE